LAYARKVGVLSLDWLKDNKDALDAINTIVTILALSVAGVLAYYRFFRGRTLATRADLSIDVDVIKGPQENFLHSIMVSVNNKGTVTIWEPRLVARVIARNTNGDTSESIIDKWQGDEGEGEGEGIERRFTTIDSEETSDFFTERFFSKDIWAVTYIVTMNSTTGDSWTKVKTVENRDTVGRPRTA
jgi:hypothetical protein